MASAKDSRISVFSTAVFYLQATIHGDPEPQFVACLVSYGGFFNPVFEAKSILVKQPVSWLVHYLGDMRTANIACFIAVPWDSI